MKIEELLVISILIQVIGVIFCKYVNNKRKCYVANSFGFIVVVFLYTVILYTTEICFVNKSEK